MQDRFLLRRHIALRIFLCMPLSGTAAVRQNYFGYFRINEYIRRILCGFGTMSFAGSMQGVSLEYF